MFKSKEVHNSKGGTTDHSAWRNYDDLNEYFWLVTFRLRFSSCFHVAYETLTHTHTHTPTMTLVIILENESN